MLTLEKIDQVVERTGVTYEEAVASETGATTDVLNPLEGLTEEQVKNGEDYLSIMDKNLSAIVQALQ